MGLIKLQEIKIIKAILPIRPVHHNIFGTSAELADSRVISWVSTI